MRRTYEAVIANKEKYGKSVFIVYYDEHGGFYDHVPPPNISYAITSENGYNFESLGPRIPAIIVSPFVKQGSVSNLLFDHTSVLQLIAEKFTPGTPYNKTVNERRLVQNGIKSISAALNNNTYWQPPPSPSQVIEVKSQLGLFVHPSAQQAMFQNAFNMMLAAHPKKTTAKYPEIVEWHNALNNRIH